MIAGPSGAGKSSIVAAVLQARSDTALAVSVTTRTRRRGEIEGVDRSFVDDAAFDRLIAEGAFLEHATVHGGRYGTPHSEIDAATEAGNIVLLEIDIQGARAVREAAPDAVLIFILPPSPEALRARLAGRATETPHDLAVRLANAEGEMAAASGFDHAVVNDVLGDAVAAVLRILEGLPSPAGETA